MSLTVRRPVLCPLLLACAALAAPPAAAAAGAARQPVLQQIRLPHSYYYREMYLPQVLNGPSSAAWAPDGRSLVVAMQGSLWIHSLDTSVTRQVTDGPGYDSEPDWSRDGRLIVYSSYRDDAVELRVLDPETGATRALVANGAVNVDARIAPAGDRVAFVSTAFEGRFHIFTVALADAPAAPERLTEDRDSGLPRYYYSVFDHYLSPAWSPDGRDLLFVSNRGHIWGTGGIWRARAAAGAEAREIRDEETTWKAHPDWAPDGRRVAYSSYLGGQWNQIWLMTSEGGDPFPLTYGDFDHTAPRWSPDGRHIAYISNERGGTDLMIVDLPGGRTTRVDLGTRRYLARVGRLTLRLEDASGRPIAARVSVQGPDDRFHAPDDAWQRADDSFVRGQSRFEYGYFHARGRALLTLDPGRYRVEVSRGPEWAVDRLEVDVPPDGEIDRKVTLRRLVDLPARGWRGADLHVHMNYGGAYRDDPRRLAFQAEAEGLNLVEDLVVNKEQRFPDIASFSTRIDPVSTPDLIIAHGQEFHTSYWGHTALLGLRDHLLLPGYASYVNTAAASAYPDNSAVFDLAHAQGAVTGYVHPFDTRPDPDDDATPLTYELPVDVALGTMDYFEVMGFSDDLITTDIWYKLLNCGFRIPAGAGTDAMANYASMRGPVGLDRVYARTGAHFDHRSFLDALKAGRTFVTNAPVLLFTLAGRGPGEAIALPPGPHVLEARVTLRSPVPIDHLEIVARGAVVAEVPLTGDRTRADATVRLDATHSGWYVLRARADAPVWPILDAFPYGTTSPVYVKVGSEEVRSKGDAAFFVRWIDRLREAASGRDDWNNDWEKDQVLQRMAAARAVFSARGGASE